VPLVSWPSVVVNKQRKSFQLVFQAAFRGGFFAYYKSSKGNLKRSKAADKMLQPLFQILPEDDQFNNQPAPKVFTSGCLPAWNALLLCHHFMRLAPIRRSQYFKVKSRLNIQTTLN
jgi:hypothetical protein